MIEASSQRLFFALWPDDGPRQAIAQVAASAVNLAVEAKGRWVPERNLHATLVFLGQVPQHRFVDFIAAAQAARAAPFELQLDRLEMWRDAGVLVVTASRTPAGFGVLVEALRTCLNESGFAVDTRPARLHVTLGRKITAVPPSELGAPIVWTANEFVLVRSDTLSGGAEYTVLRRWTLG